MRKKSLTDLLERLFEKSSSELDSVVERHGNHITFNDTKPLRKDFISSGFPDRESDIPSETASAALVRPVR